jgi:hypothetical protein
MVGIGLVGAQADGLKDFMLQVPSPEGWTAVTPTDKSPNFGGKILAMWERETDNGRAAIYVVGQRTQGQLLLEVTASLFAGDLEETGINFTQFPDGVALGRPVARFALAGVGDGRMLTALDEDVPDKQKTYMELLMLTHFWADKTGTDFIEFAVGCPDADKRVIVPQFRKMVAGSSFTGEYGSKPGAPPAAATTPAQTAAPSVTPDAPAQGAPAAPTPDAGARPGTLVAEVAAVKALSAAGFSAYWPTDKDAAHDLLAVANDGSRVVKLAMAVADPLAKAADPLVWRIPVKRAEGADLVLLSTNGGTELWLVPFAKLQARGKVEDGVLTLVGSDMGENETTVYEFLQDYRNLAKMLSGAR